VVTIYHWDTPEIFSPLGTWSNDVMIDLYADYASKVFEFFGDRVKTWITFNKPKIVCVDYNELQGEINPPYPNGVEEYLCARNILLSHAKAYHIYNKKFKLKQRGKVGITLNLDWEQPARDNPEDEAAAEQRRQFEFGLFANPIFNYNFPKIVIDRVGKRSKLEGFPRSRLPKLTPAELLDIHGSVDFLGLNHYTAWLVEASPDAPIGAPSFPADEGTYHYQPSTWESTGSPDNKVAPWALTDTLRWIKKTYHNPEILITECGYADTTGTLDDYPRIDFLRKYFNAALKAIYEDHVDLTGFTIWSLLDDFEWTNGYTLKYGLFNVDFNSTDRTRTPKLSAEYVKGVIKTRVV